MTPPDSDERKTEREMCTCGSRGVHHKPTCAVVAWLREQGKPDSGEREVQHVVAAAFEYCRVDGEVAVHVPLLPRAAHPRRAGETRAMAQSRRRAAREVAEMTSPALQPAPCFDVRFTVEMKTNASNARGHSFAHAKAIKLERDTVALAFLRFLPRGVPGFLDLAEIQRIPRGTTRQAKALAKKTGRSLAVSERILRPACPLVVELTRVSFGKLDDDNLRAALKATRDQIAWEMGINDRDLLVRWDYESPGQEHGPRGYAAVRVRIRARDVEVRR